MKTCKELNSFGGCILDFSLSALLTSNHAASITSTFSKRVTESKLSMWAMELFQDAQNTQQSVKLNHFSCSSRLGLAEIMTSVLKSN